MINLLNIYMSLHDVLEVKDISLVRNLCNQVINDIQAITKGNYAIENVIPNEIKIIVPFNCNQFIGLFLNDVKMRAISPEHLTLLNAPIDWYNDIEYYCYSFITDRLVNIPGPISTDECKIKIEFYKKYSEITGNEIDLPDQYQDIIFKGILSKIFFLPKYQNDILGNHYQQLFQNTLSGIKV